MFWYTVDMEPVPIQHSVFAPGALGMDARYAIRVVCRGAPVSNASKIRSPPNTPTVWASPPGVPKESKANETTPC